MDLRPRYAALALALALGLQGAAAAQARAPAAPLSDPAEILRRFPRDAALLAHGVKLRLRSGDWLELTDNPFGPAPPALCWYAPALQVAGVCQVGPSVAVTVLVDLASGRRVSAPGAPRLIASRRIAVGPDPARGVASDSLTVVRADPGDLVDEGGAQLDGDWGPGDWLDADCYGLAPRAGQGRGWLERTRAGWRQVAAAQSAVCEARHGR